MKKISVVSLAAMLMVVLSLSSCELVGDIFKAGMWVGIIVVVAIIALIIFLIRKIF
ncbi:MAG TPA: hypothetical protein VL093_10160 [Flavipsychrobacter sp.]|jgi:hypothetical protein|nr:hypothetical protein [Flavipsychrobacter sp.]